MQDINALKQAVIDAESAYKAAMAGCSRAKSYDQVVNEGGEGYSTSEAMSEAAYNKHAPLIKAAKDALFTVVWTLDALAERRAEWNANVVKCKSHKDMSDLAKRLGYGPSDLIRAKALHGIQ